MAEAIYKKLYTLPSQFHQLQFMKWSLFLFFFFFFFFLPGCLPRQPFYASWMLIKTAEPLTQPCLE